MAIRIQHDHELGLEEAKLRVDRIRSDVQAQYGLTSAWDEYQLKFTGAGVDGHIRVDEDQVQVDVRLGFTMMLMESMIRSHIADAMDKHLA